MSKVAPDSNQLFQSNLTATLKAKGVKKLNDLVKHYGSITDAVNQTSTEGFGEVGKQNYDHVKNLTIKFKKRQHEYDELKSLWSEYEKSTGVAAESAKSPDEAKAVDTTIAVSSRKFDATQLPSEICSDKDLAVVLLAMIQEAFYNPETGLWNQYDAKFQKSEFTKLGKAGWETDKPDGPTREAINRKKNDEVSKIMETTFVNNVSKTCTVYF